MSPSSLSDARLWIRRIDESIEGAQDRRSRLVSTVLAIPGMTSPLVKHFLNNLCQGQEIVYLEIGCWQGATITASSCNNPGRFLAIDNFSEGDGRALHANRRASAPWCRFEFIERDCWQLRPQDVAGRECVNVYFYDGSHTYQSQVKAFVHFDPLFAREFVAVVDDWNHPPVRKGTRVAFDELNYEVVREWELPARFNGDRENWWNGLYVALVRKPGTSERRPTRTSPPRTNPRPIIVSRVPTAAVVIPCHNYGHWLPEAIESALGQTRSPSEVLVIDDDSTDDTARIAEQYAPRGVRYRKIQARSVWEARKAGFESTTADVICFLDADDWIAPDYLESGLALFVSNRVGIVYSDIERFGLKQERSDHPPFDRTRLETENFMHAGSLVRRRALEVSRAFDAPVPHNSHADWYLWRWICDVGFTAVKQPALYHYRRHEESMIVATSKRRPTHYEYAHLNHQPVTIVCPLSGRAWAWEAYRDWLERQTWPRPQCTLLVIDSGPTPGVREWLSSCGYPDTRYLTIEAGRLGLSDLPRAANASEVRLAVSRIYNRMARAVETPFAFVLEDDVIPSHDVIDRLMHAMGRSTAAVTGAYQSRFASGHVAWRNPGAHLAEGQGVEEINGCGFGCLLIRRAAIREETFASLPGEHPDYDIAFFQRLRSAGWKVKIDWEARAEHLSPRLDTLSTHPARL